MLITMFNPAIEALIYYGMYTSHIAYNVLDSFYSVYFRGKNKKVEAKYRDLLD
jgi:hypothetical protein